MLRISQLLKVNHTSAHKSFFIYSMHALRLSEMLTLLNPP